MIGEVIKEEIIWEFLEMNSEKKEWNHLNELNYEPYCVFHALIGYDSILLSLEVISLP